MKLYWAAVLSLLIALPVAAEAPNSDNYLIIGGGHSAWDSALVHNAFGLTNSRWFNATLARQEPVPMRSVVDNSTAGPRAELGYSWALASGYTRGTVLAAYQRGFATPPAMDQRSPTTVTTKSVERGWRIELQIHH